jgi:hypothetical protein
MFWRIHIGKGESTSGPALALDPAFPLHWFTGMFPESEQASQARTLGAMESRGMTNLAAPRRIASHGKLKRMQVAPLCKGLQAY